MISQLIFQVSALKRVDSRGRRQLSTVYRLSSIVILSALSVNRTQMTQKKPILLDFRGDCFLTSGRWTKTAWSSQKLPVHLPEVGTPHKIRLNQKTDLRR